MSSIANYLLINHKHPAKSACIRWQYPSHCAGKAFLIERQTRGNVGNRERIGYFEFPTPLFQKSKTQQTINQITWRHLHMTEDKTLDIRDINANRDQDLKDIKKQLNDIKQKVDGVYIFLMCMGASGLLVLGFMIPDFIGWTN